MVKHSRRKFSGLGRQKTFGLGFLTSSSSFGYIPCWSASRASLSEKRGVHKEILRLLVLRKREPVAPVSIQCFKIDSARCSYKLATNDLFNLLGVTCLIDNVFYRSSSFQRVLLSIYTYTQWPYNSEIRKNQVSKRELSFGSVNIFSDFQSSNRVFLILLQS